MSAREEADRRYPYEEWAEGTGDSAEFVDGGDRRAVIGIFEAGASWIADPDNAEAVEAVAQALYESVNPGKSWEDASGFLRSGWHGQARAALTALRGLVDGGGS